ncbi:hypothetical protein [Rheinheimera sp.]|uniref:hypothetical protein n=1 Tax=Rheinheimera sp. TaxID=1869214 RepID=UPI0027348C92|nr:hypothetical protein [Rheinheimera sp.]MDP2715333.1 hypothetical protein [Rheinheimera sp.]
MKKLEHLIEETRLWNNGKGVDVDAWIGHEGNFNLALGYSTIFWPRFMEFDGYIFREGTKAENVRGFEAQTHSTRKSVECVINHVHIFDFHNHENDKANAEKIAYLGNVLKEIYEAKLAWQFPSKPCTVSLFMPDDPEDLEGYQLTFWQTRHETDA